MQALRRRDRARVVATVAQSPVVPAGMSVLDYVLLGRTPYIPPLGRESAADLAAVHDVLDRLDLDGFGRRELATLSGGERQRVFLARALAQGATLLLLDEPTEGLAPVIVQRIGEIIRQLKGRGFTILLVEQNFHFAATVADRHYIMEDGHVVEIMTAADVKQNLGKLQAYLGV